MNSSIADVGCMARLIASVRSCARGGRCSHALFRTRAVFLCAGAGVVASALISGSALASPPLTITVGTGFTGGTLGAAGFPDPLKQYGSMSAKSGSGGGSTGGGFAGFANAGVSITDHVWPSAAGSQISISGHASHYRFDGFTAAISREPLTLELTRACDFKITNTSTTFGPGGVVGINPVTFTGAPGSISNFSPDDGVLARGTYTVRFGIGSGHVNGFGVSEVSEWYSQFGSDMISDTDANWSILLTPRPTASYFVGVWPPPTDYYVQGQSFTPSAHGNLEYVPLPPETPYPVATPALTRLYRFSIEYAPGATPFDQLFIYEAPPTPAAAATGAGSLYTGTHIGGGSYVFSRAFLEYNTKYYAVLPGPAPIVDGGDDVYSGGVDMFPREDLGVVGEGYGSFDIAFEAQFEYVPGCPGDLNRDGVVDDSDFQIFVVGYNALLCSDVTMTEECPANLNSDLVVDDGDFQIFATAYNELVCP